MESEVDTERAAVGAELWNLGSVPSVGDGVCDHGHSEECGRKTSAGSYCEVFAEGGCCGRVSIWVE